MAAASRRPGAQRRARFPRRAADQRHPCLDHRPRGRLFRKGKGKEAKLCFMGHLLMENRHGLIVDGRLSEANGTAERDVAEAMLAADARRHRITVGGDKNFDTAGFVAALQRAQRRRRMSPRTPATAARRSTAGPRAIPATRSASASASGSRRGSAGSRRSPCSGVPGIAARSGSAGSSPWRPRPTT